MSANTPFNRKWISKHLVAILVLTLLQTFSGPILSPTQLTPQAEAANSSIIQTNLALDANATAGANDVNTQMTLVGNPPHTNSGVGYYTFSNNGVATASQKYAYKQLDFSDRANVSIFMWVYPTAAGVILNHSGQTDPFTGYRLTTFDYTSAGKFEVGLYNSGPVSTASTSLTTPLNNWYYLGLTYDGSTIRGYLNGKQFNTVAMGNWTTSTSDFFHIGTSQNGTCFTGVTCSNSNAANFLMGEFSVYRSTLSASEVLTNYEATTNRFGPTIGNPSNQSTYVDKSAIFSIPACTATTSGSSTCNYQWQLSTNGGTTYTNISGATSVSYPTPTLSASYNGYKYRIIVYDPGSGSPTSDALFTISSAATLTVSTPPGSDTDTALSFNGVNQYVAAPSDGVGSIYDFGAAWTTQAWIKPGANCVAGYCNIIGKEYSFLISTIGNKLIFCTGNGTGWNIIWREAGGYIPTGAWSHIATTYTGTTLTIYLNGTAIHVSNSVAAVGNNAERFTVGARTVLANGDASSERFQGEIDEVRVWNSARSQANIASDMHNRPTLSDSNLKAYFDFNEGSGSALINRVTNSLAETDLALVGSPSWQDVNQVSTSGPYTVTSFPRSYINSLGGWRAPAGVRNVRYLVVAGGGAGGAAGGNDGSGGGGAGGVLAGTFSLSASTYSVTVGAGGASSSASASSHNPANFNGGNSIISGASLTTITSIGGGSGSSESSITRTASNGGSGGGAGGYSGTRGTGTAGQGNNGGSATGPGDGGGGGAGAPGGNGNSANGGTPARAGGIGVLNDITGTNTYYGGGGGAAGDARNGSTGGAGGLGGGGNGAAATSGSAPTNGAANTGGGGGGAAGTNPVGSVKATGAGGSGIIIIRWITATAPIYTGPKFDTLTAGLTETFTVTGSATSPLTRNFRWQVSTDTGTSWSNASQGSGFLTANYVTPTLETTTSGIRYQYRVVVTDSDTAGLFIVDTSTAVYLMINPRNTITSSTGSFIFTQKYGESRTAVFTFAYGTGPRTATVASTTNNQNGKITWSNLNSDSATVRVGTALPVGTYSETLTVTDSVTAFTTQALTITVSKADTITVTTTLSTSTVTYTESPAAITTTQTVTGLVNSETATVTSSYTENPCVYGGSCLASATIPTEAGTYKVGSTFAISSPASLSNYQGVESVTATLTINKARQKAITIGQYLAYPNISSYPLNVYGGSGPGVLTRTLVSAGTAGCSLASSFILTATSVGSCTVKAEKAGTRNYIVESTTATIYWIAWLDNYAAQTLGGNNVIPLAGGNQIIVRTETLTASAFSNTSGGAITSAAVGATIRINSTGFSGLTPSNLSVTFRPYEDAVVSAVTSTYVEVVIPAGATTGVIAIDSPRGVAYTQSFTISP